MTPTIRQHLPRDPSPGSQEWEILSRNLGVEGTLPKSQMIVRLHPDVARVVWRWNRWHHYVDYSEFRNRPLIPDPAWSREDEPLYRFGALRPRTRTTKVADG